MPALSGAPMVRIPGQGAGVNLFAGQDREAMRRAWRTAWQRQVQGLPLEPIQAQLAGLIATHPEYHALMSVTDAMPVAAQQDDTEATDAYLHLALHLALREQLATDRPPGIARIHQRLSIAAGTPHAAEHRMIAVLARTLWEAQRAARAPDEQQYLEDLLRL
jgi:hypothetical protein